MQRESGEGSIYQRKDGRWVAAITLEPGKRTYLYAKTKQEARERLQEKKNGTQGGQRDNISIALTALPFKTYRKLPLMHTRGGTPTDSEQLLICLAAQILHPFVLNGQHSQAGDYVVKGQDSTWIVERTIFETSYQLVAADEDTGK